MRKRIGIGAGCLWVFLCSGGSAQTGGINLDANTRAEIENGMDEQISLINHKAPIDAGPQQKLLRAARHGEIVVYTYELTIGQECQATTPRYIQRIVDGVIDPNKETHKTRGVLLLDAGYELNHVWYDQKATSSQAFW